MAGETSGLAMETTGATTGALLGVAAGAVADVLGVVGAGSAGTGGDEQAMMPATTSKPQVEPLIKGALRPEPPTAGKLSWPSAISTR